jgi:outer membrane usher protein
MLVLSGMALSPGLSSCMASEAEPAEADPYFSEAGREEIVIFINLNHVPKRDYFVFLTYGGDFLIRAADLLEMGFQATPGESTKIGGERYISLRSMDGVEHEFYEETLTLMIDAPPSLLPKREYSLRHGRRHGVLYPRNTSVFLNYGLSYTGGDEYDTEEKSLTNEFGARKGNALFLTDTIYREDDEGSSFIRLMTSITLDRRKDLRRAVLGDFLTPANGLAGNTNMGGVSFSKTFKMDPYFIESPTLSMKGYASSPSTVEVFKNGISVYRDRIPPGEFEFIDIFPQNGTNEVDIIITDSLGKEWKLSEYGYFSSDILRKGLHEYSYSLGRQREGYGTEVDRYGDEIIHAWHRYGLNNRFTLGYMAGYRPGRANLGPSATFILKDAGVVDLLALGSRNTEYDENGLAGALKYSYYASRARFWASARSYSRWFTAYNRDVPTEVKALAGAGFGFSPFRVGSLNLSYVVTKMYVGHDSKTASASFSRSIMKRARVFVRVSNTESEESETSIYAGMTYTFGGGVDLQASHEDGAGYTRDLLKVEKELPDGEGLGYRLAYEQEERDTGASTRAVSPLLRYNGRYGTYGALYSSSRYDDGRTVEEYSLSASGSIAYVGGEVGMTRTINDSFALVKVEGLEGAPVNVNNREIGKTGKRGSLFVPKVSSYMDNAIEIDNRGIPIDYSIEEFQQFVSPPLRSGSVVAFMPHRFQGFTGVLLVRTEEAVEPLQFLEITMVSGERKVDMIIGTGGEFYFENAEPGSYELEIVYEGRRYSLSLEVPESDEAFVDLGEIIINGQESPPMRDDDVRQEEGPDVEDERAPAEQVR